MGTQHEENWLGEVHATLDTKRRMRKQSFSGSGTPVGDVGTSRDCYVRITNRLFQVLLMLTYNHRQWLSNQF